jgi:hypothetical protein
MMSNNTLNAEMRKHALAAAQMVREEYQRDLDFSEATIGAVEAILNGFWKDGDNSVFPKIIQLFASYIGEMIRHQFPAASWLPAPSESATGSPNIVLDDIELFPFTFGFPQSHRRTLGVVNQEVFHA